MKTNARTLPREPGGDSDPKDERQQDILNGLRIHAGLDSMWEASGVRYAFSAI
ncbi:MAG: hypothetical protein ACRD9L_06000 [Bryobacteraceae bacterium]